MIYSSISFMAGARGIEPRSQVLETHVLAVVLCPFIAAVKNYSFHIVTDEDVC
jgi:hypothetical protein